MKEFLTIISYMIIFIILLARAKNAGIVDGTIMLLLVPFLVNLAAGAVRDTKRALRACVEELDDDD